MITNIPEKTSFISEEPSSTQTSIMAEPRICPASTKRTRISGVIRMDPVIAGRLKKGKALIGFIYVVNRFYHRLSSPAVLAGTLCSTSISWMYPLSGSTSHSSMVAGVA